ncbi:MAG: hypothetical protein NC935_08555, partial [Candidatus Omnitrophica bacterium]|nr:hypothetical protein [Candidatus Omnitrophota bacterium]
GSFYFALKLILNHTSGFLMTLFSSIFFGLALSSKISALYILPLNFGIILLFFLKEQSSLLKRIIKYLLFAIYYLLFVYLSLRFANPYYFQNSNFFDLRLSESFVSSINNLKLFTTKEAWYPPGVQWINKPVWALLSTTFFAGLGPINFMVMIIGLFFIVNSKFKIVNRRKSIFNFKFNIFSLIFFWVVGYFIYQSLQFAKSIRYTIYLYPFFAIFGGVGISVISYWLLVIGKKFLKRKFLLYVLRSTLYVILLIWPVLFSTIYFHKNTRVEASEWIYKNLPTNLVILGEHWDDPLPLYVEDNYGKNFQVESLPVFDPDTPEKWQKMREFLKKADYYVLSSNRGWGSIPTVPERYPKMSQFYQALLTNNCQKQKELTGVCYKKIKEFLPYYYKFIHYPDSWIEETFTVYDHQTVLVYERIR